MKKQILFMAIIIASVYGCKKESSITTTGTDFFNSTETENDITSKEGDAVIPKRALVTVHEGDNIVDVFCPPDGKTCLDEFVVYSSVAKMYDDMTGAIKADDQMNFFKINKYADVYGVEEIPQIQDALEKGHLKVKIMTFSGTDFNIFIKPQHEMFSTKKMISKTVMAIRVVL